MIVLIPPRRPAAELERNVNLSPRLFVVVVVVRAVNYVNTLSLSDGSAHGHALGWPQVNK